MPTYNEISDYVINHELWSEHAIDKLHKELLDEVKRKLSALHETPLNFIMSDVRTLCKSINRCFPSIYYSHCYKNNKSDNFLLCSMVSLSEITLACDYFDLREEREEYSVVFSVLGESWLTLFACNQFELIQHCYPAILTGLKNGMLTRSLPVPRKPQKLGVLAMEMMAREYKQTIDWDEAKIPVDPFYQRFCDEALFSADSDLVRDWLVGLCDKHLEWADNRDERYERGYITGYEIERVELLLWPFEYQAVKNYRARHGLTTPEIEHPLLTSPMAMEHIPDFKSWQRWDWFDPLLDFVTQKKPELVFLKTLFNE